MDCKSQQKFGNIVEVLLLHELDQLLEAGACVGIIKILDVISCRNVDYRLTSWHSATRRDLNLCLGSLLLFVVAVLVANLDERDPCPRLETENITLVRTVHRCQPTHQTQGELKRTINVFLRPPEESQVLLRDEELTCNAQRLHVGVKERGKGSVVVACNIFAIWANAGRQVSEPRLEELLLGLQCHFTQCVQNCWWGTITLHQQGAHGENSTVTGWGRIPLWETTKHAKQPLGFLSVGRVWIELQREKQSKR